MSWELFAMKFPREVQDIGELPEGFREVPIGTTLDLVATLVALPNAHDLGHNCVSIETPAYVVEMELGKAEICTGIKFAVFGDGSAAVKMIRKISERLGVRTWDIDGSKFLERATEPGSGHEAFQLRREAALEREIAEKHA
jgi:hypothetical protein